jgi:hypothetical protein
MAKKQKHPNWRIDRAIRASRDITELLIAYRNLLSLLKGPARVKLDDEAVRLIRVARAKGFSRGEAANMLQCSPTTASQHWGRHKKGEHSGK